MNLFPLMKPMRACLIAAIVFSVSGCLSAGQRAARDAFEEGRSATDDAQAIQAFEEALRLDPTLIQAHEELAALYARREDKDPSAREKTRDHLDRLAESGAGLSPRMQQLLSTRQDAVLAALRWLAHHQAADGRWGGETFPSSCRQDAPAKCTGLSAPDSDIPSTSLALLAFCGAGYAHLSKENYDTVSFGSCITLGLQWLITQQQPEGRVGATSQKDHALATLSLVEAYGLTGSRFLKEPAQKAVDHLCSRRRADGGWSASDAPDVPSDPLPTGWALFALRSAQIAGLKVPAGITAKSAQWLLTRTTAVDPGTRTMPEAFALAVHGSALGKKGLSQVAPRMDRLAALPPPADAGQADALYALLGMTALATTDHAEGRKAWDSALRMAVNRHQRVGKDGCADGSWDPFAPADASRGRVITTALNTLALEVRYRFANVFCGPLPVPIQK